MSVLSAESGWNVWLHLTRAPPGMRLLRDAPSPSHAQEPLLSEPLKPAILERSLQPDCSNGTLARTPGCRGNLWALQAVLAGF